MELEAPPRPARRWTLRLPNPPGHVITGVTYGKVQLPRDADGRVDLTKFQETKGKFRLRFSVKPAA